MMRLGPIVALGAVLASATVAQAERIVEASYGEPTSRYQHGVFGETSEWGALKLVVDRCAGCASPDLHRIVLRLPETHVFEDIVPRLVDLDGDGEPEVVVVETDMAQGARLSVYGPTGLITATPYIGQTRRWLAPAGFGDFNDDGLLDIAYVETPHLGKVLRIFTLRTTPSPHLEELGRVAGITNHRIGDPNIWGGVRVCQGRAEVIGADGNWSRMMVARLQGGELVLSDVGPLSSPAQLDAALRC